MCGCVTVRRVVTASDVTAAEAHPQVHPNAADAKAILAASGARSHIVDLIQMRALPFGVHALTASASRSLSSVSVSA